MDKEIKKRIEDALDKAMIDFRADEESIYSSEKDTLIFKYQNIGQLNKWKKNKKCIVQGCNNRSIKKSHTIQKSGSLKKIAEDGHVLTPRLNKNNGNIELISIGINDASTFPGFCSKHEKLFEDFEIIKDFQTGEHFGLQLYRTVCREIVIAEDYIHKFMNMISNYKTFRDKKITEATFENLGEEFFKRNNINLKNCNFEYKDSRLALAEWQLKNTQRYLNEFLYKFHDGILNDLNKKKFQKITYKAFVFDRELPVALAGRGNFNLKLKTKFKSVEVILNVLPLRNKTFIFIATLKKYIKELDSYMNQFINPLEIVSLIENWMIHGTDHWFIKPSIWNEIDEVYQKVILEAILDISLNIGHEFNLTIFNNQKMESIKQMEDNYSQLNQSLINLLNKEKKKLTFITKP